MLASRLNPLHSTPASRHDEQRGNFLSHYCDTQSARTSQHQPPSAYFSFPMMTASTSRRSPSPLHVVVTCCEVQQTVELRVVVSGEVEPLGSWCRVPVAAPLFHHVPKIAKFPNLQSLRFLKRTKRCGDQRRKLLLHEERFRIRSMSQSEMSQLIINPLL